LQLASSATHERCVEAWLSEHRAVEPTEVLESFERALIAIWSRASVTLGELTVSTVVASVLRKVKARHPSMQGVFVAPSGVRVDRTSCRATMPDLLEALRFTLVELLRMIGRFTAEILTPPLHAELARLGRRPHHHAAPTERTW